MREEERIRLPAVGRRSALATVGAISAAKRSGVGGARDRCSPSCAARRASASSARRLARARAAPSSLLTPTRKLAGDQLDQHEALGGVELAPARATRSRLRPRSTPRNGSRRSFDPRRRGPRRSPRGAGGSTCAMVSARSPTGCVALVEQPFGRCRSRSQRQRGAALRRHDLRGLPPARKYTAHAASAGGAVGSSAASAATFALVECVASSSRVERGETLHRPTPAHAAARRRSSSLVAVLGGEASAPAGRCSPSQRTIAARSRA